MALPLTTQSHTQPLTPPLEDHVTLCYNSSIGVHSTDMCTHTENRSIFTLPILKWWCILTATILIVFATNVPGKLVQCQIQLFLYSLNVMVATGNIYT